MSKEAGETGERRAAGRKLAVWLAGSGVVAALALAISYPLGLRDLLANRAADKQLAAAMNSIPEGSDPWEAFLALQRAEREALASTGAKAPTSEPLVTEKESRWLASALQQGNEVAILAVVGDQGRDGNGVIFRSQRFTIDRALLTERVLSAADAAASREPDALTISDKWMLRAAGRLYVEGIARPRDTARAVALFAKSWQAGDTLSALDAARVLRETGDKVEAYRWALRCTGPCRPADFNLALYQEGLTPAQIEDAQRDGAPPIVDHRNDPLGG